MPETSFPLTGFTSTALHTGQEAAPSSAHVTPIFASSTYTFDTAEQGMRRFAGLEKGYLYTRLGSPNFTEAEKKICAFESFGLKDANGSPMQLRGLLHASGQAALTTMLLANLKKGDKILSHYSLYGGTHQMMMEVLPALGVECILADLRELDLTESIMRKNPDVAWLHLETPANPTIRCVDIAALTGLAKQYQLRVSVDNTFATPWLQQPFKYGVDFVFHSTTKFLNGHGTAIGGILIGRDIALMESRVASWHKLLGGTSSPFDAYLLTLGMKTLELRMERHCQNAQAVADFLDKHPMVARVNFTGLTAHPDHELCSRQMRLPAPVMSVELKGGLTAGKRFIDNLKMCTRAVSLGTVDTLVSHPASMSHAGLPPEQRQQAGISDGLVRMSIGIENIADILTDLDQALQQ